MSRPAPRPAASTQPHLPAPAQAMPLTDTSRSPRPSRCSPLSPRPAPALPTARFSFTPRPRRLPLPRTPGLPQASAPRPAQVGPAGLPPPFPDRTSHPRPSRLPARPSPPARLAAATGRFRVPSRKGSGCSRGPARSVPRAAACLPPGPEALRRSAGGQSPRAGREQRRSRPSRPAASAAAT